MTRLADTALVAFCGSGTRVAALGVLANSDRPLTAYRVSKLSGVQPIKVYQALARASKAGLVQRTARGYRLTDPDIRDLLRKRVRVYWSESWYDQERARAERAEQIQGPRLRWFDPKRYRPNRSVAQRYSREVRRPKEKDAGGPRATGAKSRKQN